MPNKPPRNKPNVRRIGRPQSSATLLQRIIGRTGRDSNINQRITSNLALCDRLRSALPAVLQVHLLDVREKPGELVLFTDFAVWATRLKLAVAELAGGPGAKLPELKGARVTVKITPRGGFRR
jgi:hypothetical protein